MVVYMQGLSTRCLPYRLQPNKGLGQKYAELMLVAFKLSVPSDDGVPFVLLSDGDIEKLNDTCCSIDLSDQPELSMGGSKKTKKKEKTTTSDTPSKAATNMLDRVDLVITKALKTVREADIAVSSDALALTRLKLLELIFHGCKMAVNDFVKGDGAALTLTSMDEAEEHFASGFLRLHAATASLRGCAPAAAAENHAQRRGSGDFKFVIGVPAAILKSIIAGEKTWHINAYVGANMKKTLKAEERLAFSCNQERCAVCVKCVLVAAMWEEALARALDAGAQPAQIVSGASTPQDVQAALRDSASFKTSPPAVALHIEKLSPDAEDQQRSDGVESLERVLRW